MTRMKMMRKPTRKTGEPRRKPGDARGKPDLAKQRAGETDPAFAKVMAAFADDASVEVGGKFGSVSLQRDGKVFAMLMKGRLVAKLPAARIQDLRGAGTGEPMVMGKRTMKEWVVVPGAQAQWPGLACEAYAFVKGLKG